MKLEVEFPLRTSRRFYGRTKWTFKDEKLIQITPAEVMEGPPEFALIPGDNIKIGGRIYHVITHRLCLKEDSEGRDYGFVYTLKKGRYVPPRWIPLGEISE